MLFETTTVLLNEIEPYVKNAVIDITSESKDCRNRSCKFDHVNLDAKNHVGFEVFDHEIVVFYFTGHYHFEEDSSKSPKGTDDYIEQAKSFLKDLFEYKIRHIEYYKGKTLYSEKYYLCDNDNKEKKCIGNTWFGLSKFIHPLGKKSVHTTTWQFDKRKGTFTTRQPKTAAPNAIEVIDISDDCYIEIFNNHNVYTYNIMELHFDDDFGMHYWAPAINLLPTGMYDTKDKATSAATEALKSRSNLK